MRGGLAGESFLAGKLAGETVASGRVLRGHDGAEFQGNSHMA